MHNSLRPKGMDLLDTQKEILKEILDARMKAGEIKSSAEYQLEWDAYMNKIESDGLFTAVREHSDVIDADLFNESFQGIEADMRAAFRQLGKVDETMMKHQRLNQSLVNNLKLRMKKLADELTKQEELAGIQGAEELHFETFIDANQMETNHTYYTERNNKEVPLDLHAKWDPDTEAMKLPVLISDNGLIGAGGIRLGTVKIRKQLGVPFSQAKTILHDVSHAIDTDTESFWSEQIVMDAPIEVEMGEEYYDVSFGALVELEIAFDYVTVVNELGLSAFGEYPFELVGVKYFESDEEDEAPKQLIHPGASIAEMQSGVIDGSLRFNFPDITAKRMRIVLNQPHYVKTDFMTSTKEERNLRLWLSAQSEEGAQRIDVKEYEVDHVLAALTEDTQQSVSKYEYQYGLYNLHVARNEYHSVGVYISKEIPLDGTVKTVRLQSKEYHPTHMSPLQFTDIEHSIHDGVKWYPILPYTQDRVRAELLFPSLIQGNHQATLRFTAKESCIIRKNGVEVGGLVALLDDKQTVLFGEYDASAYYTAEYVPTREAWMIDFLEEYRDYAGDVAPNQQVEEFQGTNSKGSIKLMHRPFVDKSKLNQQDRHYNPSYLENEYIPVRVRMIDSSGYHIQQPMNEKDKDLSIKNVTNYFQSEESILDPYDDSHVFYQYRVVGDEIQFNTVIPSGTRIVVEYPYLVSEVRVKSILRRNMPGFHGLSPILENYVVHFQTLV